MWGAFQTGFVMELGGRLQKAGCGETPFTLTAGSSSGSLVATVAAAGAPFDHDFARSAWIEFGKATRIRPHRHEWKINPYPRALRQVFDQGLVDTERAFRSSTNLIVTAARYSPANLTDFRERSASALSAGMKLLLPGPQEGLCGDFWEQAALLLEAGSRLFEPLYFSTKPARVSEGTWNLVENPSALRRAVEASSRIPFLYGEPIADGESRLIDGVFANNAPVEIALRSGAEHVFIVTSSRKGNVFERPVQSLVRRQFRRILVATNTVSSRFKPLHDLIPRSAPLDLETLRRRYPGQQIHVIHPGKRTPNVNRFFESRPETLGTLYDGGREAAASTF